MTNAEKELYIQIVSMMIEHFPDELSRDKRDIGCPPFMDHVEYFERYPRDMRYLLAKLGFAKNVNFHTSQLSVTKHEAIAQLQTELPTQAPKLNEMLEIWFALFTHSPKGCSRLPNHRNNFKPANMYSLIMPLLVQNGFAEKTVDGFCWSSKFVNTIPKHLLS